MAEQGTPGAFGDGAMDAYSRTVSSVAAAITPSVASLRTRGEWGEATGSAVVFTPDGFLLTNAHVLGTAPGGTAHFADGTSSSLSVVGADPLSDLAVVRVAGQVPEPVELGPLVERRTELGLGGNREPLAGTPGLVQGIRPRAVQLHDL